MFYLIYILLFRWNEILGTRIVETAEWSLRKIDEVLKDLEEFKWKHAEIIHFPIKRRKEEKFGSKCPTQEVMNSPIDLIKKLDIIIRFLYTGTLCSIYVIMRWLVNYN